MQYSIVNYSHHAVHYVPRAYFITGSLVFITVPVDWRGSENQAFLALFSVFIRVKKSVWRSGLVWPGSSPLSWLVLESTSTSHFCPLGSNSLQEAQACQGLQTGPCSAFPPTSSRSPTQIWIRQLILKPRTVKPYVLWFQNRNVDAPSDGRLQNIQLQMSP